MINGSQAGGDLRTQARRGSEAVTAVIFDLDGVLTDTATLHRIAPAADTGGGFALMRTAQFVAISLCVAILGSILNGTYRSGLVGHLAGLPAPVLAAAKESVAATQGLAPHVFAAARDAYTNGMSDVMVVSAVVLFIAAVPVALLLPARPAPATDA